MTSIRIRWQAAILGALVLALGAAPAQAVLEADVTNPNQRPIPVAVTTMQGEGSSARVGQDISAVISADLERSGLFKLVEPGSFIERPENMGQIPRFGDWRLVSAEGLVTGRVNADSDGRLRVEFRLWDVVAEQQMTGMAYKTEPRNWRRVAHIIADEIYKRLTGEQGYFDTRVVYVSESGPATRRIKKLAIMDQDGENHRFLTDGSYLVLTPRFSPVDQTIAYLSYYNNRPRVYLFNLETQKFEVLGDYPGMTFAPRFSPDGNKVIMSHAEAGNIDIHVLDLRTRYKQRLTNHPAIDTSPTYAPDGRRIVFNSDRGGNPQIYVMDADGGGQKRISFGEGRYGTPVWSPRGDLIAFTKIAKGTFYIGVMEPDGSRERILTESYRDEAPTWSPNGRVVMFFRETRREGGGGGSTRIYSVDLTGRNLRQVPTPVDASDPAWSPLSAPIK